MSRSDVAWLGVQVVVFVIAFVVLPITDGVAGAIDLPMQQPIGWLLLGAGAALALWGMAALGRQLAPQPTPVRDGQVVVAGPYRLVRHPIYSGVLLMVAGSATRVLSLVGVAVIFAAVAFFAAKSRYEERLLVLRYGEDYEELQRAVRWRVIPGIV